MKKIDQLRSINRLVAAAFRINAITDQHGEQVNYCDVVYQGYLKGAVHISITQAETPLFPLDDWRKAALFRSEINLTGENVGQKFQDAISTLESFANDREVAA